MQFHKRNKIIDKLSIFIAWSILVFRIIFIIDFNVRFSQTIYRVQYIKEVMIK